MEDLKIYSKDGKVLFESEKGSTSIREVVEEAVRKGVSLNGAKLHYLKFNGLNLDGAKFDYSDLSGSDFSESSIQNASFHNASLVGSDFSGADLYCANFSNSNMCCAKFKNAKLICANLLGADLDGANLLNVDLNSAIINGIDFRFVEDAPFIPSYLPEGEFIAWKKTSIGLIIKLKILEDSKRSRSTGDKCRCDKALVLEFQDMDGKKIDFPEYTNINFSPCTYKVGEVVYADSWDGNRWDECSHGIHFFIDRESAVRYNL